MTVRPGKQFIKLEYLIKQKWGIRKKKSKIFTYHLTYLKADSVMGHGWNKCHKIPECCLEPGWET